MTDGRHGGPEQTAESTAPVRLNKYLSDAGVCSRRQADRYAQEGRITIDGQVAELGQKVLPGQKVCVDGRPVGAEGGVSHRRIVLAVNKPRGIVCTTSRQEKDNIVDFVGYPERIYPMGRLDKDSEGLILMTNDGELMDEILRARNGHEKEYEVQVNRPVSERFLKEMAGGVPILDTVTRPCRIRKTGTFSFRIILTQGLNRQIRRMCEALGYRVRALKRIRVMNIHLGELPTGAYRELSEAEIFELMRLTGKTVPAARQRRAAGRQAGQRDAAGRAGTSARPAGPAPAGKSTRRQRPD